jgi:hypothetical protein
MDGGWEMGDGGGMMVDGVYSAYCGSDSGGTRGIAGPGTPPAPCRGSLPIPVRPTALAPSCPFTFHHHH